MRHLWLLLPLVLISCGHQRPIPDQINTILDAYHDLAILMEFDQQDMIAHVAIGGYLTSGTDLGCQQFAEMIRRIAELDHRISLEIYGSFVPCLVNPIPNEWARALGQED